LVLSTGTTHASTELFQCYYMVCAEECSGGKLGELRSGAWECFELTDDEQFGVASGLGLFPVTFDWAQIAYIGSPLMTPFWAALNVVGGLVVVMWIVAPFLCELCSVLDCSFLTYALQTTKIFSSVATCQYSHLLCLIIPEIFMMSAGS
jgi:OPT oligopeptide transporter protein